MKAGIFNPYWDTLGGGERYTLAFAEALAGEGYRVDIQWPDSSIIPRLEARFNRKISSEINVTDNIKNGDGYDLCFWVSDGSIPTLKARKNLLHFQVPFNNVSGKSLLNKMKLFRVNKIICNSYYTKKYIDQEYGVDSTVIYPPIDVAKIKPKKKEKIILYIGRFSTLKQKKRQDILLEAFKKFVKQNLEWKLVLIGGAEVGSEDYLETLKQKAEGLPVEIITSPPSHKLIAEYIGKATFFWSAAGFEINPDKNPELAEHFGITLVEAMAGGVIPLAYKVGGPLEIIKDGENGYLWETTNGLIKKTQELIENKNKTREIIQNVVNSANKYSYEKFFERVRKVI